MKKENASFYIGTYTNGGSEGIYKYDINDEGKFILGKLVAKTQNPSFLTLSTDKQFLVAVNEIDEKGEGKIESYKISKDSLTFVNKVNSGGAHPCHVVVHGNNVFVANYTGGNMSFSSLNKGKLSNLDLVQHQGKGTTSRQEAPHVHSVIVNKQNDEIIAIDLGTNELWFSALNVSTQKLESTSQGKLIMEEGAGPRHAAFHPIKNNWLYVFNELNSTISLINRNQEGVYEVINSVSTLPKDFKGDSYGADIHISSDGKFLYASNRGHNSISIFTIDQDNGSIQLITTESVKGNWPRNFTLSPDEKYVLVANQYSNNIVSFLRNAETGLLTYIDQIKIEAPVCILFKE
ncbi:lactonase family protein [Pseudotenacibaculum sp. MALMAid0570]|uniref:lactonase family protein n=1 Tax=Pseudotenacibaculum sp. MALMAid0570 TaxID=3143938 RepID=UPI0032DF2716